MNTQLPIIVLYIYDAKDKDNPYIYILSTISCLVIYGSRQLIVVHRVYISVQDIAYSVYNNIMIQ